ncbi:hypothetical protein GJAV_G00146520 [Gymnothorax javanicus]|nr:hypothetical protein GJAV_G00146520 [Gymnothorax javanicus]
MSESIVRKIQPFTIGTKLSVPSLPKSPNFEDTFLPRQSLDTCQLQNSLNDQDQVDFYLGQTQTQVPSPQLDSETTGESQMDSHSKEDNLNRNGVSPTSSSRSIRKITISGGPESPGDNPAQRGDCLVSPFTSKPENINVNNNNNNNNVATGKNVPRIVGVSCEEHPIPILRFCSEKTPLRTKIRTIRMNKKHVLGTQPLQFLRHLQPDPAQNDCSYTQCNTVFNREVLQAEAWIKGKLQDLRDGWDVQRSPLQDWGEVSQTIQRELKDFENTLIQLNQMGEQLVCAQNPNSDQVSNQLSRLEDQWHALKQMAAKQSKALGGARNLQQFNRKADRLETWIKEKQEEVRSLAEVLGENVDKIQLTRRILDLKQDEKQYQTLHEEINLLALKLEKQGKMEGKNICVRRKHINKMWLKVQSLLKDYHENLQLALEVSSFYQQADNIISAINHKKKSAPLRNGHENSGDREIKEIASQITMLDVAASQLSNFHPTLASRVSLKQCEVKATWAALQNACRNERSEYHSEESSFTREEADPKASAWETYFTLDKEVHRIMGKDVKEEQNRLKGCASVREPGILTNSQDKEQPSKDRVSMEANLPDFAEDGDDDGDDVIERHQLEGESDGWEVGPEARASGGDPKSRVWLRESAASTEKTLLWLKDSIAITTQDQSTPGLEGCPFSPKEEDVVRACRPRTKEEGKGVLSPEHTRVDNFREQLDHLWEELRRTHQPMGGMGQDSPRQEGLALHQAHLQEDVEDKFCQVQRGTGQELQDPPRLTEISNEHAGKNQAVPMGIGEPVEELKVTAGIQKDSAMERAIQPIRKLLNQCSSLTMRINHALSLTAELSMDIMDAETDMAVKCEPDRSGLQGLQEQQDQMELEYEALKDEVAEVGKQGACLDTFCPEKWPILGEEVQATLQAWEELGRSITENRDRLQQFGHLQDFFRDYLAMISWTEDTRACIFSESSRRHGKGHGVPATSDLDLRIERKFGEFDQLAAAGQRLMEEEHHLAELIKERTEELQSMLGWILVHWKAQKHQRMTKQRGSPQFQQPTQQLCESEDGRQSPGGQQTAKPGCHDDGHDQQPSEEVENGMVIGRTGQKGGDLGGSPKSSETPVLVLKEPSAPSLGGTVNLILSFGKAGDSPVQVQKPEEEAEVPEPMHRVSTYLHVKDNHKPVVPVDEAGSSLLLLRKPQEPAHTSTSCAISCTSSSSSSSSISPPQVCSVTFHTVPKTGSASHSILSPTPCSSISSAHSSNIISGPSSTISPAPYFTLCSTPCSTISSVNCPPLTTGPASIISTTPSSSIITTSSSSISPGSSTTLRSTLCSSIGPTLCCTSSIQKVWSKNRRRVVAQRMMGEAGQEVHTNTWPLKERKKRCTSSTTTESLDLAKRPLVENSNTQCIKQSKYLRSVLPGRLASSREVKKRCKHVSLGSVLSFDLPKDLSLIPSIHDVITISPPGPSGTDFPTGQCLPANQKAISRATNQTLSLLNSAGQIKLIPQGQPGVQSDCIVSHKIDLLPPFVSIKREGLSLNPEQTLPSDNLSGPQIKSPSEICSLNEEVSQKKEQQKATVINQSERHCDDSLKANSLKEKNGCKTVSCSHSSASLSIKHVCPSVHTKIQDLGGHMYHHPMRKQNAPTGETSANPSAVCHTVAVPTSCVIAQQHSVGVSSSGSRHDRLCGAKEGQMAPPDALLSRRAVGRVLSLERAETLPHSRRGVATETDGIRPDHRQFEEEEEELEDIWNQTNGYGQSEASQLTNQGEAEAPPPMEPTEPRVSSPSPSPCPSYQNLNVVHTTLEATDSTSNLLVAEFRLPPEVQSQLGYNAPCRSSPEQHGRQKDPETQGLVSDPQIDQPHIELLQKHLIPERGRGSEREGQDVDGQTEVCTKVQSVSWLPVSMQSGEKGQQEISLSASNSDIWLQGPATRTRGRCNSMNGNHSETQTTEGILERKHLLEKGKKAPCRVWHSSKALLVKDSLQFCDEDGLQEPALTLQLTGAQCIQTPDCRERPHCFSLRLRDDSEYRLCAPSSPLMRKWVQRIQACTGVRETDSSGCCSGSISSALNPTAHSTPGNDITSSNSGARATELVIVTGEPHHGSQGHHGNLEDCSSASSVRHSNSQEFHGIKQRSHSFTSATYQKIKPARLAHGVREVGSSYSVTLFIGDQPTGASPPKNRAESPILIGQQRDIMLDSLPDKSKPPKSQNKSVFKKFFGKERF